MKKVSKLVMMLLAGVLSMASFASCDDNNDEPTPGTGELTEKEQEMKAIAEQFVSATVNETYKLLAGYTDQLCNAMIDLREKVRDGSVQDADVKNVCDIFLEARAAYEESEAFLFGAASDFGIDPHIDTWPLDLPGLAQALTNDLQIEAMDVADDGSWSGDTYAGNKLGQELLGFHGIEFVIFRNGAPRTAADLLGNEDYPEFTAAIPGKTVSGLNEVIFAAAVAGDLRNCCFRMEVAWNKEAPAAHITKVEELEWPVTVGSGDLSYGENFLMAGQAGSTYATWRLAMDAILVAGCQNIADEVGQQKMGQPAYGTDINYIESPYSHMSLVDFHDNMVSIENCYMGGREEVRDETKSLHAYLQKYNPELDTKVVNAINDAKAKIKACPAPFVQNYTAPEVKTAIEACSTLSSALSEASEWISAN